MSEHLILTLGQIRAHRPCLDGWRKLLAALGYDLPPPESTRSIADFNGRFDPSRRVSLGDVAWSNGASDALWCVGALPNTVEVRRAVVGMILPAERRAAKLTTDARVHDCIASIKRWQAGDDGVDLKEAWVEAWSAVGSAEDAARAAAWAAGVAEAWPPNGRAAARAVAGAAEAAAETARSVAWAAWAAAWAAGPSAGAAEEAAARAARAARSDYATELANQRADIIAASPPLVFAEESAHG